MAAHVAALVDTGWRSMWSFGTRAGGLVAGVRPALVDRRLAGPNGLVHDPARLASALSDLLA